MQNTSKRISALAVIPINVKFFNEKHEKLHTACCMATNANNCIDLVIKNDLGCDRCLYGSKNENILAKIARKYWI